MNICWVVQGAIVDTKVSENNMYLASGCLTLSVQLGWREDMQLQGCQSSDTTVSFDQQRISQETPMLVASEQYLSVLSEVIEMWSGKDQLTKPVVKYFTECPDNCVPNWGVICVMLRRLVDVREQVLEETERDNRTSIMMCLNGS